MDIRTFRNKDGTLLRLVIISMRGSVTFGSDAINNIIKVPQVMTTLPLVARGEEKAKKNSESPRNPILCGIVSVVGVITSQYAQVVGSLCYLLGECRAEEVWACPSREVL